MSDNNVRKVSFWRIFFPALIALMVGSIISIIFFFSTLSAFIGKYFDASDSDTSLKKNTFLHLNFKQVIGDVAYKNINTSSFSLDQQHGLAEIIYGLEKAKNDDNIKGIFIELTQPMIGYANLSELREAIKDFQKSGKKVVFYLQGEAVSTKALYLASASKDSYIFPETNVEFLGISSQLMFYKNLLDKFEVDVEVIRGSDNEFKSAVEPFFRSNMSDSSRLQIETYINGIWNNMLTDIATDRNTSVSELNKLADNAKVLNGKDAVNHNLLAGTKYRDEIIDILKKYAGTAKNKEVSLYDFEKYGRNIYRQEVKFEDTKEAIALIFAEGDIATNGSGISSANTCKHIREARNNDKIKTIVLRVNSPGGSALASEEIWREVKLAADKKKVYVSMGNLAASGGYYISSPATRIFADATTITGSIGVFGMIPNFEKALNKHLGITFDEVKTNKYMGMSVTKKMSAEELAIVQREVNNIYDQFIKRVSDGRKLTPEQTRRVAKGRVWLGKDAVNIGLVDEIGGLSTVIKYARKQVGQLPIVVWPKVNTNDLRDIFDMFDEQENTENTRAQIQVSTEINNYLNELKKFESKFGVQMRMPYEIQL